MLTESEMLGKIEELWSAMTEIEMEYKYIQIKKPVSVFSIYGTSSSDDGYYLHIKKINQNEFSYVLSTMERGRNELIIESNNFNDIEYQIAMCMVEQIIFLILKNKKQRKEYVKKYNFKGYLEWHMRWDMQLDLLKKTTPEIYQKAIEEKKFYMSRNLWAHMTDIEREPDFIRIEKPVDSANEGYYLYNTFTSNDEINYIFSQYKNNTEEIIIQSINSLDLEYEMAWRISEHSCKERNEL